MLFSSPTWGTVQAVGSAGLQRPGSPASAAQSEATNPLDTAIVDGGGPVPESLSRWLSVDQIRKMQRMRRERVIEAMDAGELQYEQRGRIRYARLTDVVAWEERRLRRDYQPEKRRLRADLAEFA